MVLEEFVGRARLKVILFAYCMLKGQFRKGADLRNVIFFVFLPSYWSPSIPMCCTHLN